MASCSTDWNVIFPSQMGTTAVVEIRVASKWLKMSLGYYLASEVMGEFQVQKKQGNRINERGELNAEKLSLQYTKKDSVEVMSLCKIIKMLPM